MPGLGPARASAFFGEGGFAVEPRIDFRTAAPGAFNAMLGLEEYVRGSEFEPALLELVRTRASQLNR